MTELEKIDLIRERTGVGYAAAKTLLEAADGDLVKALILHEEDEKQQGPQGRIVAALKELLHQGNMTRLRVRKDERTYLELPVTAGVIGAALAPQLFMVAGLVCLMGRCSVDFQRADDADPDAWHSVNLDNPGS